MGPGARAFAGEGVALKRISLACGALFGGRHLLLIFDAEGWSSVVRFSVAVTLFGLNFPVLILRA